MPISASPVVRRLGVAIGLTSAILPIIAVASLLLAVGRSPVPTDFSYFGPSGAHLLLGRFGDVYRDPGNQGGPLEIIPAGIATLAGATGPVGLTVFYLVNIWALLVGASMLLLSVVGPARRTVAYVVMGAGALAVLVGFIPAAIHVGHPSQAAIPLLWIGAAVCAQRDRPVATGVLLGVSVGSETWGILGALGAPWR